MSTQSLPKIATETAIDQGDIQTHPLDRQQWRQLRALAASLTPDQRLWSSGYLAGLGAGLGAIPETEAAPPAAEVPAHITILYASQSGNAHSVANRLEREAQAAGLHAQAHSTADFKPKDLAKVSLLLLVTSTQGEGEPPESALNLHRHLFGRRAPDLQGLRYAVFGLGDSSYEHFNQTARDFDRRLTELGAQRIGERVDADVDFQTSAGAWIPAILETAAEHLPDARDSAQNHSQNNVLPLPGLTAVASPPDRDTPFEAVVIDHRRITTPQALSEVYHLAVEIDPDRIRYRPGDALGIRFRNQPALIESVLQAVGPRAEDDIELDGRQLPLGEALEGALELTQLHPTVVNRWAAVAAAPELIRLTEDRAALREYAAQRQFIDLVREFPADLNAQVLADLLQPMQPRLYSIASSQAETEDEVHLTVSTLRYHANGRETLGGASGFLNERLQQDQTLEVFVAENPAFHLPSDGDAPLILIGAGTGVAPFRAFLQQRAAQGDRGRNWLAPGNRHFHHDFLYQADWLAYRKAGLLNHITPAFSRMPDTARYVQDRLRREGAELYAWIRDGAHVYVCGGVAMETGVREALTDVAREHGGLDRERAVEFIDQLRAQGRYRRDIY